MNSRESSAGSNKTAGSRLRRPEATSNSSTREAGPGYGAVPEKDVPTGTLKSIEKQAGLKLT